MILNYVHIISKKKINFNLKYNKTFSWNLKHENKTKKKATRFTPNITFPSLFSISQPQKKTHQSRKTDFYDRLEKKNVL